MPAAAPVPPEKAVFLNVPFDPGYEPLFLALIASLVSIGRAPRCVLEIPESGQGRLRRIIGLIESCRVSIHDLSRVGAPARFNMPFELGLAYSLRLQRLTPRQHVIIVLEAQRHRLSRTLSDLAGYDPGIHEGKPRRMISAVLDSLSTPADGPYPDQVYRMWLRLMKDARRLRRLEHAPNVFSRVLFGRTVIAATELAAKDRLIRRS
jgi:hypothetical protein